MPYDTERHWSAKSQARVAAGSSGGVPAQARLTFNNIIAVELFLAIHDAAPNLRVLICGEVNR